MYFVFVGHTYYPSGGWSDFAGTGETLEDALKLAASKSGDWWHIVDSKTMSIVLEST